MHPATLQLAPILAAEKSRVPFYIAGGLLVGWALIVSIGIGMRRPDFPGSQSGERLLIAISVVLVIATALTAVLTASTPAKAPASASAATTSAQSPAGAESQPAASAPKATTGTPVPASSPAATTTTTSLKLAANPEGLLKYDTKTLSAKAGTVTISMANMSPVEHNVTVASGTTVLGATPTFMGGTRTLSLKLKPGTYTFYCSVPGHRQAGMEGTLTVSS